MGGRGGEVTLDKPQVQQQGTGKVGSEPNLPQGGSPVTLVQGSNSEPPHVGLGAPGDAYETRVGNS